MGRPPGRPLPTLPAPADRRSLRKLNGVTIVEAARECGVGRDVFSKWERGIVAPRPQHHHHYYVLLSMWARMLGQPL